MAFTPGTRLGPYVIDAFISAGGMGKVYAAHDPRLGRRVAIKVLPQDLAEQEEFRRRFEREIQAASRLNHKNICTIYDAGRHEDRPFIVMELLEGETLEERLHLGPLDTDELLHIGIQVAAALEAAHREEVIHRDVKTGNIFLTQRGDAKVLDFGIAKAPPSPSGDEGGHHDTSRLTAQGVPLGTVAFMSPEQASGGEVDARSDIYSLGLVLYQMATGVLPYDGTPATILSKVVSSEPVPPPMSVRPSVGVDLDRIITRALEKDPQLRYQTAGDLLSVLRTLRRDRTTTGGIARHGRAGGTAIFPREKRLRGAVTIPLTLMVVLMALGGWWIWGRGASAPNGIDTIAVLPCASSGTEARSDYLCDLLADRITAYLSQIPGLTALSPRAVQTAALDGSTPLEVGRELGADALVTAQLFGGGPRPTILVELIDAQSGAYLWSEQYSNVSEMDPGVYEQVALEVSEQLQLRLSDTQADAVRLSQLYQRAGILLESRTPERMEEAIDLYSLIVEEDPTFAEAFAGLASAWVLMPYYAGTPPNQAYPEARTAAETALRLDDTLASAHAALGLVKRDYDRDLEGAEEEFQAALEADPTSGNALQWDAELLAAMEEFRRAEVRIREAQAAMPLELAPQAVHGWILMCANRDEEARQVLEETLAKEADFVLSSWFLGQLNLKQGNFGAAITLLSRAVELTGGAPRMVADLASAYAQAGQPDRARDTLEELDALAQSGVYVSRYEYAVVYTGLGELDRAIFELDVALQDRTWQVVNMKIDPMLEPLRSHPEFPALVEAAGLRMD